MPFKPGGLLVSAAIALWAVNPLRGQAPPLDAKTGGALVGDMSLDKIYLTRDLNGDGDADDAGEVWVYFDETNASGIPSPTGSVYVIFQSVSGYVFYGDGASDAVYRLRDLNGDGDALDAGEANVWFSDADNFHGFRLPTPNGIFQDAGGATYILNAGTGSIPADAIYRTVDLNGDGDCLDDGETILWAKGNGSGVFIDNPRSLEYILPPCPGDLDGDFDTDQSDLGILLSDWNCGT